VNLSVLTGANKRYIETHIPHIAALFKQDCAAVIDNAETVIVGSAFPEAVAHLVKSNRREQYLVDLVGLPKAARFAGRYEGICWGERDAGDVSEPASADIQRPITRSAFRG
jgi:GDP-mannose 6-dehydrogenase